MKRIALATAGVLGVLVIAIVALVVMGGTQPAADPIVVTSPTPTASAEQSPAPSPSPTSSPSPGAVATATPEPTPPPTASPTATPEPTPGTPEPTAAPTAPPTTAPSPTPVAHGWLRTEIFWDHNDGYGQSRELRAVLQYGDGERLLLEAPSIAVDGAGHAHVVWSTSGWGVFEGGDEVGGILYATNASGEWRLTELTTPRAGSYDTAATLAVDGDGSAVVAFLRFDTPDSTTSTAYLMTKRSGRWSQLIEVPYPYSPYRRGPLALRDGVVHLAFAPWTPDGGPWQVRYAAYDGATWTSSPLIEFARGYGPRGLTMGVTEAGDVRIGFIVNDSVYVATGGGGSFTVEPPIELEPEWDMRSLFTFDRQGGLHLLLDGRYARLEDGRLSQPRAVFPRVTWVDGFDVCGARGPSPHVLGAAPDGTAHVLSFFDGPLLDSPWYSNNRGAGFQALKLYRPDEVYEPGVRLRERIDDCNVAIDIDPVGLDMAIDDRGRPHILTSNRLYFIGPEH